MADIVRERIIARALVLLNTSRPAGVPEHHRTRAVPFEPAQLPAAAVFIKRDSVEQLPGPHRRPLVKRRLTIAVEYRVVGTDAVPADKAAAPMCGWATAVLAGGDFEGLTHEVSEGEAEYEYDGAARRYGMVTILFHVEYATNRTNQEQLT